MNPNVTSHSLRRTSAWSGIIVVALLLTGCVGTNRPAVDVTRDLQAGVVAVADAAAAGDASGGLNALDALEQRLAEEVLAASIDADTAAAIQNAITVVRADLTSMVVPEVTPTAPAIAPSAEPPTGPDVVESPESTEPGNNGNGNGKGGNNGNGNSGNSGNGGGNNGNGNGN